MTVMTVMTPSEVSKTLGISSSTLRKYSLLFEKEQITFERNQNNSRQYTDMQVVALQEVITATKNGSESLENAVKSASNRLKGLSTITQESTVTTEVTQRYDDDVAAVMLEEIRSLKEQLQKQEERQKERDSMFVEVLENLQQEINLLKEQTTLPEPSPVEVEPEKKGFFARLFNK